MTRSRLDILALALSLWLCVPLLIGCKSRMERRVNLDSPPEVTGIAVYPFGFRWEEPGWRHFAVSQRLLQLAAQELPRGLFWFGPAELKVVRAEDNSFAGSDLVTALPRYRLQPEQMLVIRPWAEKRVSKSQKSMESLSGKALGSGAAEETVYVGHVDVFHPSSGTVIAELREEVSVDPFVVVDSEVDPTPALTALMERLMGEASDVIDDLSRPRPAPSELGVKLRLNPLAGLTFGQGQSQGSSAEAALDRELAVTRLVRFFHPDLSEDEASRWGRFPPGLRVESGPSTTGLQPGDVILRVAERPAFPQTLERERLLGDAVLLEVRRASGAVQQLSLPPAR